MNPEENSQSNPEIGMSEGSFESAETTNEGSKTFFDNLDNQVNSGIIDDTEVTQNQTSGPEQVTHDYEDEGSNNVEEQSADRTDWEKRYKDSSREAVKWRDRYQQVERFVPVLEVMKKDSGLVDHVREYLVGGGKPAQSIQESLGLEEDFMFDQQEALTQPDSDSAKLLNAHVDKLVQGRISQVVDHEKKRAVAMRAAKDKSNDEKAFMEKNNMTAEQFENFKQRANEHTLSLDDVNYLLNRDKAAQNVAQSTKQDMLNQMKNVRNMPTSASGANSQGVQKTADREVFENILGFDSNVDNLFG